MMGMFSSEVIRNTLELKLANKFVKLYSRYFNRTCTAHEKDAFSNLSIRNEALGCGNQVECEEEIYFRKSGKNHFHPNKCLGNLLK